MMGSEQIADLLQLGVAGSMHRQNNVSSAYLAQV